MERGLANGLPEGHFVLKAMRLVKLSTSEFANEDALQKYFTRELPKRNPKGLFVFGGHIAENGLTPGETILFSYRNRLRYVTKAETGRMENIYWAKEEYPFCFVIKLPVRNADVLLEDVKRKLRAEAGFRKSLSGQVWNRIPDSEQAGKAIEDLLSTDRGFWVVSPNVRNDEETVGEWKAASVREDAAFMGWEPNNDGHGQIGPRFAGTTNGGVKPGHMVLIARRHQGQPEIVGFGVVQGDYATKIRGFKPPQEFGSLRRLSPFKTWSKPPPGIPLVEVLRHTKALVQLHPDRNSAHKTVCQWMEKELSSTGTKTRKVKSTIAAQKGGQETTQVIDIVDQPGSLQLDYKVQTREQIIRAKKIEFGLLDGYRRWLIQQDRNLSLARYGKLQCDGYEERCRNLIEAKASTSREHVRMAVGQLLDYAFQGEAQLGKPHKAVLLPARPDPNIEKWLRHLNISIIWRDGKSFFDNANGQFT
jgi:uncharacterized protein YacL (UPF0231 family)